MENILGMRIKDLRTNKKMTLKELAQMTGFSISFLSQLERGKSSATLESLKIISLALDVTPGYFFDESEGTKETIVNRGSSECNQMDRHNIYYQSLSKSIDNPAFSPLLVVLKPDQNEGNLIQHEGQEFLFVLEGKLTVQIDGGQYVLKPSDSIMFDSRKKHYWYNYTDQPVKFLCVSYDMKNE